MIKIFEIMITNIAFRTFSSDYHATKANSLYCIYSFVAIKWNTTVNTWEKWKSEYEYNKNIRLKFVWKKLHMLKFAIILMIQILGLEIHTIRSS
jgi:hypothetical protein